MFIAIVMVRHIARSHEVLTRCRQKRIDDLHAKKRLEEQKKLERLGRSKERSFWLAEAREAEEGAAI